MASLRLRSAFLGCSTVLACMALHAPTAAQTINKCQSASGQIEYTQTPCTGAAGQVGTISGSTGPTSDAYFAAQERLQRQQEYLRQRDAAAASEALAREKLSIERQRVEQGAAAQAQSRENDKWLKETLSRHTGSGWEYRTRAEWIEYDRAAAERRRNARFDPPSSKVCSSAGGTMSGC